jgi:hypothetical protein
VTIAQHGEKTMTTNQPSLPYNGSSGWSGSDTSKQRADLADTNGTTKERQSFTFITLFERGYEGITWKELSLHTGWHHGVASGVLSVLHKDERIYRIRESRDRCKVYVHPTFLHGREYDVQGRKPKECPNCGHSL